MQKSIENLISDIQALIRSKEDGWFDEAVAAGLSADLTSRLQQSLGARRFEPTLRLSGMGPKCPKALWYSIRHPELAEPLPPWAEIKYAFGHIIEGLAVALAKAAGHEVTGEQDELVLDGIVGHRDCVVDGCIVDVKSASSIAFQKFKSKDFSKSDSFGYLDQLDGYVSASRNDPLVRDKGHGYILAIDKTLGHMVLYRHEVTDERIADLKRRIFYYKEIVAQRSPPGCECRTIPQGASGNLQLDFKASYSPYKYCCFPFLRTFLYSNGPVDLVKVVRKPDVPELSRFKRQPSSEVSIPGKLLLPLPGRESQAVEAIT